VCDNGHTYDFVVNSGGGQGHGQAWDPAFALSQPDGGRFLFIPTMLNLTFQGPEGPPFSSGPVTKGNQQGSVTCTVEGQAINGPFSFSGTVMGNIVARGNS
jgi:hypothetical protein